MAGAGSRFSAVGYKDPKPLISVNGIPMIKVVINNIRPSRECHFIFICQQEHVETYNLRERLHSFSPGCDIIELNGITEGAACTVLMADHLINNDNPLMIANSDQFIVSNIDDYLLTMDEKDYDGIIMTMFADDPKWSFVGLNSEKLVTKVVEKEVISNEATVGIYNFKRGNDFVRAANIMIDKNDRANNEFYIAPVYNYLIKEGQQIGIYNIGAESKGMYGLGTPADLETFLSLPVSFKIQ
jgi:dTDP-glucose pyrophosphorylase